MSEMREFDFEFIAKSYSVQGVALDQSEKQRLTHYKTYEETLQDYKKLKKDTLKTDEQRQILYSSFTEKLKIKNSFNQLQELPNCKLSKIQKETIDLYDKMTKDSDKFTEEVNTVLKKIQNLGADFDETVISRNQLHCTEKIRTLLNDIEKCNQRYDLKKNCETRHEFASEIRNIKIVLQHSPKNLNLFQLKTELCEKEKHLIFLNKNIHFLKQQNQELQTQLKTFKE